jgi:hypothetical protein
MIHRRLVVFGTLRFAALLASIEIVHHLLPGVGRFVMPGRFIIGEPGAPVSVRLGGRWRWLAVIGAIALDVIDVGRDLEQRYLE